VAAGATPQTHGSRSRAAGSSVASESVVGESVVVGASVVGESVVVDASVDDVSVDGESVVDEPSVVGDAVVVTVPTHNAVQLKPDLLVVSPFVMNVSERLLSEVSTPVGALTAQFV